MHWAATELKDRLSLSMSLATPSAVRVMTSPMLTVRLACARSIVGALLDAGAGDTVMMIDASARRPFVLATVYLHSVRARRAGRRHEHVSRCRSVLAAEPPLPHTGSAMRLGLPPLGSLSFANTSIVTRLVRHGVAEVVGGERGARQGFDQHCHRDVAGCLVTVPVADDVRERNGRRLGDVGLVLGEPHRVVLDGCRADAVGRLGDREQADGSFSGSRSLLVTAILTELPMTTFSASAFATGGRFGAVPSSRTTNTLPSTGVVETLSVSL